MCFSLALFPGLAHSTERAPVTLHLDGIVQVLNCHLSDMAIGMMTRIAVLRWLYHLYIKTPRKMFRHTDSLFPILLQTLSDESDETEAVFNALGFGNTDLSSVSPSEEHAGSAHGQGSQPVQELMRLSLQGRGSAGQHPKARSRST
ncbi:hypothetical protein MC885_002904 [Smutsia gigantea]|nr:hypothetical protein MC885_002904 [Smutsia gigantea]